MGGGSGRKETEGRNVRRKRKGDEVERERRQRERGKPYLAGSAPAIAVAQQSARQASKQRTMAPDAGGETIGGSHGSAWSLGTAYCGEGRVRWAWCGMRWGRRSLVLGAMTLWKNVAYSFASTLLLTSNGHYWPLSITTGLYHFTSGHCWPIGLYGSVGRWSVDNTGAPLARHG